MAIMLVNLYYGVISFVWKKNRSDAIEIFYSDKPDSAIYEKCLLKLTRRMWPTSSACTLETHFLASINLAGLVRNIEMTDKYCKNLACNEVGGLVYNMVLVGYLQTWLNTAGNCRNVPQATIFATSHYRLLLLISRTSSRKRRMKGIQKSEILWTRLEWQNSLTNIGIW